MNRNFLFDLDQTLLNFHASEEIALGKVLTKNGLSYSDDIYKAFKSYNKELWGELEKGKITRAELFELRFNYMFSLCEGDSSKLDPFTVNSDFIRTMSENGVLMDGALELVKKIIDTYKLRMQKNTFLAEETKAQAVDSAGSTEYDEDDEEPLFTDLTSELLEEDEDFRQDDF